MYSIILIMRLCFLVLLIAFSIPAFSQASWNKLSDNQKSTIISEVKAEVAAMLHSKDTNFLPTRADGSVDKDFEFLIAKLADPSTTTLSEYAGELMANDYRRAIKSTTDWAGKELLASFRDNALGRLPDGSVAKVYMKYLAGKPELWKKVGKLVLSDEDWYYVAKETWKLLNKAAGEDLQSMTQAAIESLMVEIIGKWATSGYMIFLKAEVAYIREAEKLAAKVSLDNYYKIYYRLRENGKGESAAWEETSDYLIGESGIPSIINILKGGSLRDLRIGGTFTARADELPAVREEFRKCYAIKVQRCLIETTSYFDEQMKQQKQERKDRRKKTEEELAAEIKKAGGITRKDLQSVYSHLALLLRKKAIAAYQATESEQQELASIRYEIDRLINYLQKARVEMLELMGLSTNLLNELNSFVAAGNRAKEQAETLDDLIRQCQNEKLTVSSSSISRISQVLEAKIGELKSASNLVCDFGMPQSQAEAEKILNDSRHARDKVSQLANTARNLLAQLKQSTDETKSVGDAAARLEILLDNLESVTAFSDQKNKLDELKGLNARGIQLSKQAENWYYDILEKAAPWTAFDDINKLVDQAGSIVGIRHPYLETSDTISEYRSQISFNLSNGNNSYFPNRYYSERFAILKQQGWDAYSVCKLESPDISAVSDQLNNTENTIDNEVWSADLCLQRAEQLAEPFSDFEQESNESSEGNDSNSNNGWGDGEIDNSTSNNNGDWQAGGLEVCTMSEDRQNTIAAAIAQLQQAVSKPDRYNQLIASINNLVQAANHADVCPHIKSQILATLADLQNAQQQQQADAKQENLAALDKSRKQQQRRKQTWARVGSGLVTILQGLQNNNRYPKTSGSTSNGPNNNNSGSSSNQAGANDGSAQCQALSRQLSNETQKWQQLAMRRPNRNDAEAWCRQVISWQTNFTNIMRKAEQAGCASIPRGLLAQTHQISQTSCATN